MEEIWGKQLTLVPQDPLSSLNPSIQIGEQLAEPLRHHLGQNRAEAQDQALALLHLSYLREGMGRRLPLVHWR